MTRTRNSPSQRSRTSKSPRRCGPRKQNQGNRPIQRGHLRLPALEPGPFGRRLPPRNPRHHDPNPRLPCRQPLPLHHQHLPLPQPLRRPPLPDPIRFLQRHKHAPHRRRRGLHQRLRRQPRHAPVGAQQVRVSGHARHSGRGRVAHGRRRARERRERARVQPGPAIARAERGRHADQTGEDGHLPLQPHRREREDG
ncbi:hypothetical protein QJS10_CPB19g00997 [Acorus calamus]|uniref:Uncharacterized protein n=1 Tax=Acorus calamus TaxID=4465 RepID=A0AAV9CGM8_ACOCL|nr:hypothetical protein QJS10_CPB19g00997 [Acorus calamus]